MSTQTLPQVERPAALQAPVLPLDSLQQALAYAAHLLPAQGPITVFVHHNTLHAFEDMPFAEALAKAAPIFGCQPYLPEQRYRDELSRGRIRHADLQAVLEEALGQRGDEAILHLCTRLDLRLALLQYALRSGPTEELLWYVAEADSLRRIRDDVPATVRARLIAETRRWIMRSRRSRTNGNGQAADEPALLTALLQASGDDVSEAWSDEDWEAFTLRALWHVVCDGVGLVLTFPPAPPAPLRHRDLLLAATGADADLLVHEVLVRFCSAFLDQGLARWQLPHRDEGFFAAFCALYGSGREPQSWMRGLADELARLAEARVAPRESIRLSLEALGVAEDEWQAYLGATLLALRGWAGMLEQIEKRGDRVVHRIPAGSLVDFVAVRLLLERWALADTARAALKFTGPLAQLRRVVRAQLAAALPRSAEQRAFVVFQLAQLLGWSPADLQRLNARDWQALLGEVESFTSLERRRLFHLAYERRFYTQTLDAVALHAPQPAPTPVRPRFQVICCIDEREESLRRHLEELCPELATYGTAGFFAVPMYYRGAGDAHYVPLCPAPITPRHWVSEQVVQSHEQAHQRGSKQRRALGLASHQFHVGSRSFALGAVLTTAVGVLASAPLVARTLFPRLTARVRRRLARIVHAPVATRLELEGSDGAPGPGFTVAEMTASAASVLRELGLGADLAPVVLIVGHGSTSMNNPHESAHDCGACGGARGGPNARALAQMLNDPRVRAGLAQRGISVPPGTVFVGAMHNTSNETMTYYDLDRLPEAARPEFAALRAIVDKACDRDAHERARRFESAPLALSFVSARQHVEGRAEDLAQVRPEWGHATNAICIVGRRSFTRGLFLDRRAFLVSYDPSRDDADASILEGILGAVFPVCAGISLEYYFSYVDNVGWGCGTKLPHNITSLLGVMDGAASDLRTGLPWQMVEIHEPVRLLCIIEATAATLERIMDRHETIARLCRNGWVQLAVIDPDTHELSLFHHGAYRPYQPQAAALPCAPSSVDWYRGWRDHLEFAAIRPSGRTVP